MVNSKKMPQLETERRSDGIDGTYAGSSKEAMKKMKKVRIKKLLRCISVEVNDGAGMEKKRTRESDVTAHRGGNQGGWWLENVDLGKNNRDTDHVQKRE